MKIFHIPSSYPSRHHRGAGISAEDYILAFSEQYPDFENTVSLIYETSFEFLVKGNSLFKEVKNYLKTPNKISIEKLKENLEYYFAKKSIIYSNKMGYSINRNWLRKHKENLEYFITQNGKPDLIHAQFTRNAGWVAWNLAKEYNIPYVITERFGPFPSSDMIIEEKLKEEIYLPLKEADAVVSVSNSHANDIRKYVEREVIVIPNLIDEDLFTPPLYNTKSTLFNFTTISSSFQPNKGIDTLLEAIDIFIKNGGRANFFISGGGDKHYLSALKVKANKYQIENKIIWLDKLTRTEVAERIKHCDCFISSSIYESFGLVSAEAIACGKPVIATRSGGSQDIVNANNGVLVDVKNPEMMAQAMMLMTKNEGHYYSNIIRQDFINRFSRKKITNSYYNLYLNIVKRIN